MLGNPPRYTERASRAVKYIRRLANLADSRPQAMRLLLDTAYWYCCENAQPDGDGDHFDGKVHLDPEDKLMCEIIREHYTAATLDNGLGSYHAGRGDS